MTAATAATGRGRRSTPRRRHARCCASRTCGCRSGDTEVVKGISFTTRPGRCLAIVGESGSGKSVTARTLVGLTGPSSHVRPTGSTSAGVDLTRQSQRSWRAIRGREIGFILQDALVSLDQLRPVGDEIAEPLKLHGWGTRATRRAAGDRAARARSACPSRR